MGGATKRSFISAYILLSAYFLTTQSYKCMCLTTRVYGKSYGEFPKLYYTSFYEMPEILVKVSAIHFHLLPPHEYVGDWGVYSI